MTAISRLASIRIITADIRRLVDFYETVTGVDATWSTDDFAELQWPAFTLAIGTTATLALFGGDVAQAAANRSVIVEFLVDDVNTDYERILVAAPAVTVAQPADDHAVGQPFTAAARSRRQPGQPVHPSGCRPPCPGLGLIMRAVRSGSWCGTH